MNVLLVHNFYQIPGGEDQVFNDESSLLESAGHGVTRFTVHNDDLKSVGKIAMAKMTVWNGAMGKAIGAIVREKKIQVVHFTNTFPQISPAAYYGARRAGAAVVQSLHNFRFICPSAMFLRDGKVCERCMNKLLPWPAIQYGCYRESKSASAVVAGMLGFHRTLGTYRKAVDAYIPLTEFGRQKFIEAGFPAEKLIVKPNFVSPDPGQGTGEGKFALFVGRLSKEKGIDVMLRAWERNPGVQLKIAGDGPLADMVKSAVTRLSNVEWLGRLPGDEILNLMGQAGCLIFPSVWYEGLPKTIVESLAKGTPIIASKIGSMIDLVDHARTGLHVPPGDADALAQAVRSLFAYPQTLAAMRVAAREEFLSKYTPSENYRQLMEIYYTAIARRQGNPVEGDMQTVLESKV